MPQNLFNRLKIAGVIILKGTIPPPAGREDIPPISDEEVQEVKRFFPLEKFFIFGHARSGTTLLARLIRVHPEIHCNWQAHFFTRQPLLQALVSNPEVGEWLSRRSNRWNHGRDLSPLVLRGACDIILEREAHRVGKHIVGDKSPNSLIHGEAVHLMQKVYPDARLIYIVRDGRDAVLSHRFQSFIDSTQHLSREDLSIRSAFVQDPAPFLRGERSLFTPKGIQRAAEGWVRNVGETDQAGKDIYGERYISLRFEDLTSQPWREISRLWAFLSANLKLRGLEEALQTEFEQNPDAEWQLQKAGEIAQPLQKGKSGGWREIFTNHDRQFFIDIAGDTLQSWGYPLE